MQEIIMHVGLPKTGTTALQFWMDRHRDEIAQQGAFYPFERAPNGDPKHHSLVLALLAGHADPLKRYLRESAGRRMILSAEGLTNHLFDFSFQALSVFRNTLKKTKLTVVWTNRAKNNWLRSYYIQAVFNPRICWIEDYATADLLPQFALRERIVNLMDRDGLAKRIEASFGGSQVTLDYTADWVEQLCRIAGVPPPDVPLPRCNVSPPAWKVEVMRQLNSFGLSNQQRSAWRDLLVAAPRVKAIQVAGVEVSHLSRILPDQHPEFPLSAQQLERFDNLIWATIAEGRQP